MEDLNFQKEICSLDDVNKEIEEVKQRIKIRETELSDSFKALPTRLLGFAVSPVTSTISSVVGGGFFLTLLATVKKFFTNAKNKNENKPEEKSSDKKSFILSSTKNICLIGLIKIITRIIRYI